MARICPGKRRGRARNKDGRNSHGRHEHRHRSPGGALLARLEQGRWSSGIDVRDFIVRNVASYHGDETFLAAPSARTLAVWEKLQPYFAEERKKGVLDVDAATPSTVLAHAPGYIDRDNEVIVVLQTDKPFKRAIFPAGGLRMVESRRPPASRRRRGAQAFTKYRRTHNDGVFDHIRRNHVPKSGIITGLPDSYGRGRIIGTSPYCGTDRLLAAK